MIRQVRPDPVTCEWCGETVPWESSEDVKPRNHPLTLCPACVPHSEADE